MWPDTTLAHLSCFHLALPTNLIMHLASTEALAPTFKVSPPTMKNTARWRLERASRYWNYYQLSQPFNITANFGKDMDSRSSLFRQAFRGVQLTRRSKNRQNYETGSWNQNG